MSRKTKRALRRLLLIICLTLAGCVTAGLALDTTLDVPDVVMLRGTNSTLIVRVTNKRIPVQALRREAEYREEYAGRLEAMAEAFAFERIQVEINSPGGAVRAARGLAQALAARPEYKHFRIDGACGSSMIQLLALGHPDYISMSPRSTITVHAKKELFTMQETGNSEDEIAGVMQLTGQDAETVRLWFRGTDTANKWTQFNRSQARDAGWLGEKYWEVSAP